jgi:hypothetical protein
MHCEWNLGRKALAGTGDRRDLCFSRPIWHNFAQTKCSNKKMEVARRAAVTNGEETKRKYEKVPGGLAPRKAPTATRRPCCIRWLRSIGDYDKNVNTWRHKVDWNARREDGRNSVEGTRICDETADGVMECVEWGGRQARGDVRSIDISANNDGELTESQLEAKPRGVQTDSYRIHVPSHASHNNPENRL